MSNANSIGMCSRDFSTAMCWRRLISAGSVRLSTEPRPLPTSSSVTRKSGSSWICSSFSCSVIFASREFTRASITWLADCRVGASAASSVDLVAATTPLAVIEVSATTDPMIATLRLNLDIILPFMPAPAREAYPGAEAHETFA